MEKNENGKNDLKWHLKKIENWKNEAKQTKMKEQFKFFLLGALSSSKKQENKHC